VANGYTQTKGIDYFNTFSLVEKMTIIGLFLSLTSFYNWELKQLDINNVCLHGELKDVYIVATSRFTSIQPGQVCKLKRALYGLKPANKE